jgi:hypothetical protein
MELRSLTLCSADLLARARLSEGAADRVGVCLGRRGGDSSSSGADGGWRVVSILLRPVWRRLVASGQRQGSWWSYVFLRVFGSGFGESMEAAWPVSHQITSVACVTAITAFVSAHSGGWQENIFATDTPRQAFRRCDAPREGQWLVVGDETLGITHSKNFSRPLCRRDREQLMQLLQPESRG